MEPLARFVEELRLGVVDDPHNDRTMVLTEMVTVCPSCRSLNSLRHDGAVVHCVHCFWTTPAMEPAQVA